MCSPRERERGPETKTLRILAVSDHVEPQLYNSSVVDWMGQVDLIISCGDLPPGYLDFLITNLSAPMLHVLGNHCLALHDVQKKCDPEAYPGVINLDRKVLSFGVGDGPANLLVGGLEGSPWYNDGPHQYTDSQARMGLWKLVPGLLLNKVRWGRYLDIMVTHAPPRGIHDNSDVAHLGFRALLPFLRRFKPILLLHGHTHRYEPAMPTRTLYKDTQIINAYGHVIIELEERESGRGWEIRAKTVEDD